VKAPHFAGLFLSQDLLRRTQAINRCAILARTNYSYEKRQKELAKKKKKEEKRQRKLEKHNNPAGEKENLSSQED
jgi:hypothetical protein